MPKRAKAKEREMTNIFGVSVKDDECIGPAFPRKLVMVDREGELVVVLGFQTENTTYIFENIDLRYFECLGEL